MHHVTNALPTDAPTVDEECKGKGIPNQFSTFAFIYLALLDFTMT